MFILSQIYLFIYLFICNKMEYYIFEMSLKGYDFIFLMRIFHPTFMCTSGPLCHSLTLKCHFNCDKILLTQSV